MSNFSSKDKQFLWHPFTPQGDVKENITIVRGNGALLIDENGKEYIDAIASWWVNIHGHAHPHIAARVADQLKTLEHSIFSGYTHKPGIILAEQLLKLLPHCGKVFYSDDGSTSVEVALKMALQYWHNSGTQKTKFIAFENAYHGDTFGGMSVAERNVFNNAFEQLLFDVVHIPVPALGKGREEECMKALEAAIDDNTAAFIFEPLIQGAAGMIMYDAKVLDQMIELCGKRNVITIADEVMTGFGRTGNMFATDQLKHKPDIICLSKGLTGGFFPLGATLCTNKIHSAFITSDKTKTFFHGHSYTGNPTACMAALASLEVFEKENTMKRVMELKEIFVLMAKEFSGNAKVKEARSCGAVLAIELKTSGQTEYLNPLADKITEFFPLRGIILRPLGNVLYLIPPYCITNAQLEMIRKAIKEFLELT